MTPPLMPFLQGITSGLTTPMTTGDPNAGQGQPVTGPLRDRAYWTRVIHNVAKVPPNDPRYATSRQVRDQAIQGLQDLADTATERDIKDISPGKVGTALVNFGHGASLGLAGDPTYLALARQANPKTAFVSDIAGTATLAGAASPVVAGLSPVTQGVILGGTLSAARGAIEPLPGMSRGESAALMGLGGAVTGAVISKFASKFVPAVRTIWSNVARMLGKAATPQDIAAVTEGAIRSQLGKLKVRPDIIDRAVEAWKANGTLSVEGPSGAPKVTPPPPVETPVAIRPGETIIQTSPRGFEVTGTRATPPPPTTPTIAEMQGFRTEPLGKGQTLPWYPRGGQVEQGMVPLPAQAPGSAPPNQSAVLIDYLKQATSPQDAIARLGTLHNLGIPVPQDPNQILQLLFGAQR